MSSSDSKTILFIVQWSAIAVWIVLYALDESTAWRLLPLSVLTVVAGSWARRSVG